VFPTSTTSSTPPDYGGGVTYVLHAIPASHPCATVERALQLKGLPYRRVEHIPVAHKLTVRARTGESTVPTIVFTDGRPVAGSRAILHALEHLPPSLLPADRARRRLVERAEEWGDQVLQPLARRVVWAAVSRRPETMMAYSASADLPVARALARVSAPLVARAARALNGGTDPNVRADLAHLAHHLDRIDGWIGEGVLGGDEPNAGDLQLGPSVALLASVEDLAGVLADRPALTLARRWFPGYPEGAVPAGTLPPEWLSDAASSASWAPWATGP
jgi:glutathione S-transferase